ncbi:embryogenesis-like protein [Salvia miltiorrhiza]|uniref:embryogenesis-like protein n=1 Tax=Salvia miltiorrhiza TaxID=226208 RepID=UPI0025AD18A6|nr:embryogenesis-like protein [Salvia miltiorrhiza]
MLRRSSLSLSKLLHRHPVGRSPRPKSPIPVVTLATLSNPRSFHQFSRPTIADSATRFSIPNHSRQFSAETDREVDKINLKFAEAREEIESAMDSKETVYFNEEAECAREAVGEVLELYEGLLRRLPEGERASIQRAMGLKIEQLKAELAQLNE